MAIVDCGGLCDRRHRDGGGSGGCEVMVVAGSGENRHPTRVVLVFCSKGEACQHEVNEQTDIKNRSFQKNVQFLGDGPLCPSPSRRRVESSSSLLCYFPLVVSLVPPLWHGGPR